MERPLGDLRAARDALGAWTTFVAALAVTAAVSIRRVIRKYWTLGQLPVRRPLGRILPCGGTSGGRPRERLPTAGPPGGRLRRGARRRCRSSRSRSCWPARTSGARASPSPAARPVTTTAPATPTGPRRWKPAPAYAPPSTTPPPPRSDPEAPILRYPSEIARRCGPSDLVGQFILSKDPDHLPGDWTRHRLGPWWLAVHPALPAIDLIGPDSSRLGWLVGYPIDRDGRFASDALRWPSAPVDDAEVEEMLYATGGRYLCILIAGPAPRVYLDPCGSLAAVFSPRHGIVASSTALVPYSRGCEDDRPMIEILGIPDTSKWFPFGMTSRRFVHRLLPNHYLDLESWAAVRHWPTAEILPDDDVASAVAVIASIAKRHIAAVAERFPLHIGLTAGYDSRMLLACARDHLEDTVFFTLGLGDAKARSDCHYGSRIAREFGLTHRIIGFREPDPGDMTRWLYRTGCCVGEVRGLRAVTLCLRLDPWRAELPGLGGRSVVRTTGATGTPRTIPSRWTSSWRGSGCPVTRASSTAARAGSRRFPRTATPSRSWTCCPSRSDWVGGEASCPTPIRSARPSVSTPSVIARSSARCSACRATSGGARACRWS